MDMSTATSKGEEELVWAFSRPYRTATRSRNGMVWWLRREVGTTEVTETRNNRDFRIQT